MAGTVHGPTITKHVKSHMEEKEQSRHKSGAIQVRCYRHAVSVLGKHTFIEGATAACFAGDSPLCSLMGPAAGARTSEKLWAF